MVLSLLFHSGYMLFPLTNNPFGWFWQPSDPMKSSESLKACLLQSKHVLYKRISSRSKDALSRYPMDSECYSNTMLVNETQVVLEMLAIDCVCLQVLL